MPQTYRDTDDPKRAISDLLAFNSRDWSLDKADAWLWGIVFGWDDETDPAESAMPDVARRHGWDEHDVARLRRLHARWVEMTRD